MAYVPTRSKVDKDIQDWMFGELLRVSAELQAPVFPLMTLAEQHVEPVRPREGMLVYADGTDWDPGCGAGIYAYVNGVWEFATDGCTGGGGGYHGGDGPMTVKDEGTALDTEVISIDFVGAGVTATAPSAGNITVTIPGASSGIDGVRIDEEGSQVVATAIRINFIGAAFTAASGGTDYATITADPDILMADTADVLTAGFATTTYDAGTKSSGTFTPNEANGNLQKIVNGGAFTLAPPTNDGTMIIQITNNGSAGAIITSGFTMVTNSAPGTTNGDDFLAYIVKINGFSHLTWVALQ